MNNKNKIEKIEDRLYEIENEKRQLLKKLTLIKESHVLYDKIYGQPAFNKIPETPDDKIELFIKLFRCRQDVYPKLWENKNKNIKGYSPVCKNEWIKPVCNKPGIKCSDCTNQSFAQFDEQVVRSHLEGKIVIGTYTIRQDDTCIFLAADFDKQNWQNDIILFKNNALKMGVEVSIERSRSGNGAHAWIFFSKPIQAYLSRQLGTLILSKASTSNQNFTLESYDRFFPNQDFIPRGGFGNLIALPLQKYPREKGNTLFINEMFQPYQNQWEYLSKCRQLSEDEVREILDKFLQKEDNIYTFPDKDNDIEIAEKIINPYSENIKNCYKDTVNMQLGAKLIIDIQNLPARLISALKRTAIFANPKFFELQKLRFSTWKTPRYISCAERENNCMVLPRGTLESCKNICNKAGAKIIIKDTRLKLKKMDVDFNGKLTKEQKQSVKIILKNEFGVFVAPTGAGKTIIACKIIAQRKIPTLILVHRKQLIDQWKKQLIDFLDIPQKEIGIMGSGRKKLKGMIDIGMIQTFSKKDNFPDNIYQYEQVIIDECHHIPAFSFESVINKFPARYILGLTATPYRKDGHQAILYMQCGPIRYQMSENVNNNISKKVIVKETSFRMPLDYGTQPQIYEVWNELIKDKKRLTLIANDVVQVLKIKRFPLILSERKEHLKLLFDKISKLLKNVKGYIITGDLGKKEKNRIFNEIHELFAQNIPVYILSTGSLIGEGIDMPKLDTLFLAMPIAFKGRVIQYAGRLHRVNEDKFDVIIYDYLDTSSGLTISMFKKRIVAYKKMGYEIDVQDNLKIKKWIQ